jgi:hypothetical protein
VRIIAFYEHALTVTALVAIRAEFAAFPAVGLVVVIPFGVDAPAVALDLGFGAATGAAIVA